MLIETSLKLSGSAGRIFHMKYSTLSREPLAAVTAIYRYFGFVLSSQAHSRMKHFIAMHPTGGYGQNTYHFGDYGLDQEEERRRYRHYTSFFRVETEEAIKSISCRADKQMIETAAVDF